MADSILVPYDDSSPSRAALEYALSEYPDADVTVLHAIGTRGYGEPGVFPHNWATIRDEVRNGAESLLDEAVAIADDRGMRVSTEVVVGPPARRIVEYADEKEFDHIVMGSHGRTGVSRVLLGSVAECVVRRSSIPVTVVRSTDREATPVSPSHARSS